MSALAALGLADHLRRRGGLEPPRGARDRRRPGGRQHRHLRLRAGHEPGGRRQLHRPRAARGRAQLGEVLGRRALRDPHRARRDEPRGRADLPVPVHDRGAREGRTRPRRPPTPACRPAGSSSSRSSPAAARSARRTPSRSSRTARPRPSIATGVKVPPPNVGPETNTVAYAHPGGHDLRELLRRPRHGPGHRHPHGRRGGRSSPGPRDDPFCVDLGAIFDLAQLRPVGNPARRRATASRT